MKRILAILLMMTSFAAAQIDPPTASEREAGFLFRQGLNLLQKGQSQRASQLLRKSLRLEPERLEIRPYLARALYDLGQHESALRQLDLYLNQEPEDFKVGLFRVKTLISLDRAGQASDALELLGRTESQKIWEWHNLKGYLAEREGRLEDAEASYLKAIELSGPTDFEARSNLISLYLGQKRTEEAQKILEGMLSEADKNPQVLNSLALLLSRQDPAFDPSELLESLKDETLPLELQYNLTATLATRKELGQAAVLAADLVDRFPEDPRASWLYGRILLQRRELKDAGEYLLAAQSKLPNSDELVQTMGLYSYLTGDYKEAVSWYRQARERRSDDPRIHHNLSLALVRSDLLKEAIAASRTAVTLSPTQSSYVYQLALALDRDGRPIEASEHYRKFLELTDDETAKLIVQEHLKEIQDQSPLDSP